MAKPATINGQTMKKIPAPMTDRHSPLSYHDLLATWQQWMDEAPDFPPLDQWLRKQAKRGEKLPFSQRQQLHDAMMQAMHFRQLADALEILFKDPEFDDWYNWDMIWSQNSLPKAIPQHFWYWIQLRSGENWQTPYQLSQQKERRRHFIDCRTRVQQQEHPVLALLWYGIRPNWSTLIEDRAAASEWTPQARTHFVRSQPHRPPLWLRPANMIDDHQLTQLEQALQQDGVEAGLENGRLQATGGSDIFYSQAFKNGELEVQDLASQMIAESLNPQPGDKIWDACAGAGGKSLAMASVMQQKGSITATDINGRKLEELKRRSKRAGYRNIRSFEWDGDSPLRLPAEIKKQGGFDKVLVDAPCSSSGTWRRNPDARWRTTDRRVDLHKLQQKLLQQAARGVRQDGLLAYATCSWFVDENEDQVKEFLKQNPDFTLLHQNLLGSPEVNSDTMFVAVMKRVS
tara:strand:+ start:61 stop:1434 length:1374 start_codon:yes stop_codon:yes gene_type:complete